MTGEIVFKCAIYLSLIIKRASNEKNFTLRRDYWLVKAWNIELNIQGNLFKFSFLLWKIQDVEKFITTFEKVEVLMLTILLKEIWLRNLKVFVVSLLFLLNCFLFTWILNFFLFNSHFLLLLLNNFSFLFLILNFLPFLPLFHLNFLLLVLQLSFLEAYLLLH